MLRGPTKSIKGALYIIQILCRRYTFWSYPAGLTIADPPGWQKLKYRRIYSHHFHTTIAESIHTTPNYRQCPFKPAQPSVQEKTHGHDPNIPHRDGHWRSRSKRLLYNEFKRNPWQKIMKQPSGLNLRKFSFSHRVGDDWNSLPSKVVEARDVEQFKAELDEAWKDIRFFSHCAISLRYFAKVTWKQKGERYKSNDFLLLDVFRWILQVNTGEYVTNSKIN